MRYKCTNKDCGWEGNETECEIYAVEDMIHPCKQFCPFCLKPCEEVSNWTRTPPTEPGWYWFRRDGGRAVMTIIEGNDARMYYTMHNIEHYFRLEQPDGEWSARIEPQE